MGDAALDPLLRALKDEDAEVRIRVAAVLSNYRAPKVTEALLAASNDPDEEARRMIVDVLGTVKAEAAIPRLRELLADTPMVAKTAMRGLENMGTPAAMEALASGLKEGVSDPDPERRAAVASCLTHYYAIDDAGIDLLLTALRDEDRQVRLNVAMGLHDSPLPKNAQALLVASHDTHEQIRRLVVDALGRMRAEAAVPRLRELMADADTIVAEIAVRGLANIGTPQAVEALRKGLAIPADRVRARAAVALLELGDDTVRELIEEALQAARWERSGLADDICNWLCQAVAQRGIQGPGPDVWLYRSQPDAWLKWLRQDR
jgi:HEAT repeat protein